MTDTMPGPMTEASLFELLSLECRVDAYGNVCYYNSLGQLHRVHGPAIEYSDGACLWYQHGKLHKLDGPAVENGYRAWYINGKSLTEAEWQYAVASMGRV